MSQSTRAGADQERLIPSDAMIAEHSGGMDRAAWLRMGDYTVDRMFVEVARRAATTAWTSAAR